MTVSAEPGPPGQQGQAPRALVAKPPPPPQHQQLQQGALGADGPMGPVDSFRRSASFWARVSVIYGSYKAAQVRAALMRATGKGPQEIQDAIWQGQHTWAGEQMFRLCIDLRGFYLKAGQFIGARADFIPEPICRQLSVLHDRVPPMCAERTAEVLKRELGVGDLSELFEWIDLEEPLGSASISQVHKARVRRFTAAQLRQHGARRSARALRVVLGPGDTAWSVCNDAGVSLAELAAANKGLDLDRLRPGDEVLVPEVLGMRAFEAERRAALEGPGGAAAMDEGAAYDAARALKVARRRGGDGGGGGRLSGGGGFGSSGSSSSSGGGDDASDGAGGRVVAHLVEAAHHGGGGGGGGGFLGLGRLLSRIPGLGGGGGSELLPPSQERPISSAAAAAVAHAVASGAVPRDGLVAVKVQYPDALRVMSEDLVNLRAISAFLSKTEIRFDLVSAVDELQKQIHLEFDFLREARVMDSIAAHLGPISSRVAVPTSIPGLVTRRVMAMTFMDGTPLMQLADKVAHLPKWKRDKAARLILSHISEAYGRMILGEGLFQADGHPGNILVRQGGGIALLDYGQSKQLPPREREALARLILALDREDTSEICDALRVVGLETSTKDPALRRQMGYGMFDTRGRVDPFDPDSPVKKSSIEHFPPDMFFVLRCVQLLRGIAMAMGVDDFSSAAQWAPLAREAIKAADKGRKKAGLPPVRSLAEMASPLRLNA